MFCPKGIPTLAQWWGLCGHMILRAMVVVAYATGRASHARQVMTQTKRDTLLLQVGGLGMTLTTSPHKRKYCYETSKKQESKAQTGL